jgi:anti-anti-sigma factor
MVALTPRRRAEYARCLMQSDGCKAATFAVARQIQQQRVHDGEMKTVDVLSCSGEIDLETAPRLVDALRTVSSRNCVVDLSKVTFMGAAGFNALIDAAMRCGAMGGTLVVQRPPPIVLRLLDVLDLPDELLISEAESV